MQAGDQVRHGDVEQARRCDREHGRKHVLHRGERSIAGEAAQQGRDPGSQVVGERASACVPGVQQHREVSDLLRNRMRDDRQRGCRAEREVGQKRGCDHDAIAEIVHAVADHDHQAGATAVAAVRMRRAGALPVLSERLRVEVTVPPQNQFFQQKEQQQAAEHGRHHAFGRPMLERVRKQFQKHGAEQRTDGKTDELGNPARVQRQRAGGGEDRQHAAGETRDDDRKEWRERCHRQRIIRERSFRSQPGASQISVAILAARSEPPRRYEWKLKRSV